MRYTFYLNEYHDITELMITLPYITDSVISEMGDLQYKATFEVNNTSEWLSEDNENSIIKGIPSNYYNISIKDELMGITIYKGNIIEIHEKPNKIAEIVTIGQSDEKQKELKTSIISSNILEIIQELSDFFEIDYDYPSFSRTNQGLEEKTFTISASEDNPQKLADILKQLGETLGLWIYIKNNIVYCFPIILNPDDLKIEFTNEQILNFETSQSYDKIINEYNIRHLTDVTQTDEKNNNTGYDSRKLYGIKTIDIDGSASSNITIPDQETAILIGDKYIQRYKDVFDIITFTIEGEIGIYLDLIDIVKINKYNKKYVVLNKEIDLIGNKINITAWELNN